MEVQADHWGLEQQSRHHGDKQPSGGQGEIGRDQVESRGVWLELPVDILDSLVSLKI